MEYDEETEIATKMGVDLGPHFDLTSKQVPELKDWKVGEEYSFTVTAKLTRLSQSEKMADGCFVVKKVSDTSKA
jgi:hypothetical protein